MLLIGRIHRNSIQAPLPFLSLFIFSTPTEVSLNATLLTLDYIWRTILLPRESNQRSILTNCKDRVQFHSHFSQETRTKAETALSIS